MITKTHAKKRNHSCSIHIIIIAAGTFELKQNLTLVHTMRAVSLF